MKIAGVNTHSEKTKADTRSTHILPLVPSEPEELRKDQTSSFSLRVNPTDPESVTYKFSMQIIEGTEDVRTVLTWKTNVEKVLNGFNVTTGPSMKQMIENLCKHTARSLFDSAWQNHATLKREARALAAASRTVIPEGTSAVDANALREQAFNAITASDLNSEENTTHEVIRAAVNAVVNGCVPSKALQRVKRNMRREMRKPADMKIKQYFVHLTRLNQELRALPPFLANQQLSDDELVDIIIYAVPRSWIREMDRQGFDPMANDLNRVVNFLERIETSENGSEEFQQKNNHKNGGSKSSPKKGSKTSGKGSHYCMVHGNNATHSSESCNQLRREAKRLKGEGGSAKPDYKSKSKPDFKSKNKTWTRSSSGSPKKELNNIEALVAESVKRELQKAKKRKSTSDESSTGSMSLHAMEKMDDMLEDMHFDSDHDDTKSEGEISV